MTKAKQIRNTPKKTPAEKSQSASVFNFTQAQQQALYASIINSSDDAILSKSLDGIIHSWNSGAEKVYGYTAEEMTGRHISVLIPPHLQKEDKAIIEKIRNGEVVKHFETIRIRKDGTTINVSLTVSPVKDEQGRIIGISKISRDITSQKKAEQAVMEANREKEAVLNRISDGVISIDNEWKYTFLNNTAMTRYPQGKEAVLGKVLWDLHPEMKGTPFWDKYHEAMETKKVVEFEDYYAPLDMWVFIRIYPSENGLTIFYKDITESKKAEHKLNESEMHFRALIENSAEGITLTDAMSNVIYRSPGSYKITGVLPTENVRTLAHPDDIESIKEKHLEVLSKPGIPVEFQGRFLHADGHYIWLEGTFTNLLHVPAVNAIVTNYRDITERKKAEGKIAESELRYRSLIEQASDMIFIVDTSMKYLDINNAGCRLAGYTKEEFLQLHPKDLLFEEDLDKNPLNPEKLKDGQPLTYERRLKRKDGTAVELEVNAKMMDDGRVVIFARDITQRKLAEIALKEGEAKYRSVVENMHEALIVEDHQGQLVYANSEFYKMFGYSPDTDTFLSLKDYTAPDSYAEVIQRHNNRLKGLEEPEEFEYKGLRKDGKEIWIEARVSSVMENGKIVRTQSLERDITERKEAEEKIIKSEKIYKTIASSIPGSVICLLDTDFRYLLIEGDMVEKMGYSKEKLMGNKAEDVLPPEVFANVKNELQSVLTGKTVTRESTSNGYDVISRLIPLKDENNKVYCIMTVAIDITELKNAQRAISELNRDLEKKVTDRTLQLDAANKELEAFSYSVSHDLRTPLRAINGYARMLEEDYNSLFDSEGKRLLSVVQDNATKMGILIDDLLTFSRLGKKEIHTSNVDMEPLIENVIAELSKSGAVRAKINIHPLHTGRADKTLMNQVWLNLISNAVKYSGNTDHPQIEIKSSQEEEEEIIYSISDNGAGFDMQYAHKLFGVFQRLHSHNEFEGTGVGLALVHRIIAKHGGRIWAQGEVGKGATFYFSLPI